MRLTLILAALLITALLLLTACGVKETELMCGDDHRVYEKQNGLWIDTEHRCMPERAIQ